MTRTLILLGVLLVAGVAGGEETPAPELYFIDDSAMWSMPPDDQKVIFPLEQTECPEGYGPLVVELPPEFLGYSEAVFDCGRVADPSQQPPIQPTSP